MIGDMHPTSNTSNDSFLSDVFGIRRDEIVAVAWSFAYFFCVLSSYYILRPVRETMAVDSGPNTIPYLFIGTFFAMLVATSLFGWIASRYPRRVFLPWVYLFFVANILIFWFVFSQFRSAGEDYVWLGRVFFVWISVFNLFVVSVFWSFMADIYTREQGRRLFGFIASGGSIGALLGGILTSRIVVAIGFHDLLPIAAAVLLFALICMGRLKEWVHQEHADEIEQTFDSKEPLGGSPFAGITLVLSSKYFLAISLMSVIASLLGTALYMFLAEMIQTAIPNADEQTRFFSNMNNWQNGLALLIQMFAVKQVVIRFGIGRSLVLFPLVTMVGFAVLALEPTLMVVAVLTVVRRALGFGFTKPSTDMLYSAVTPEEKYKAKNAIDTAVYRGGDVCGTWTIKLLQILGFGVAGISIAMLPFTVVTVFVALWLGAEYKRQARSLHERGVL
ncbi:MAG TPA: MFS transporter [Woeseiaceae bacterium]|nr:MFS transporter [Woeseiaceae bacterium]